MSSFVSKAIVVLLAIAYPIAAHLAIAQRSIGMTAIALAILAGLWLVPLLARGRTLAWIAAPAIAYVCWWLAHAQAAAIALYLPPILIPAFVGWIFGRTLASGEVPLLARLVQVLHATDREPIDPDIWPYARRLTAAWTALMFALAIVNLALAAVATPDGLMIIAGLEPPVTVPQHVWSMFANVFNYAIVGVFFIIEYTYRRQRFPRQPYRNVVDFVRRFIAAGPQLFGRDR